MPKAVSKKQWRFMQAIIHGKPKSGERGTPPKSIASKYSSPGKEAPEQHGSNSGGTWGEAHHAKAKEKSKADRVERKKKKSKLKKSFEEFYKGRGRGAGVVLVDDNGRILMGNQQGSHEWTTPGGHVAEDETYPEAALRELREEAGIVGKNPIEIGQGNFEGNEARCFLVTDFKGKLKGDGELSHLKWFDVKDLPFDNMRSCAAEGIKNYIETRVNKSSDLRDMYALEQLEKNIIRQGTGNTATFEMTHGDATRLIGNGAFRFLREATRGMTDESFKDINVDNYVIHIRKHINDVYSGRISDGHKQVHQFQNRSLPALTAELMSVFEWYLPEDEPDLQLLDEGTLADDAIHGGINELMDNYKKHNIAEIYHEMENIREEIRHGAAVDLQQVEGRIMSLFDKLEACVHEIAGKHNSHLHDADEELNMIETKIRGLQTKIDELSKKPTSVEAYSTHHSKPNEILENDYPYLTRPSIEISPNGKIRIVFGQDWSSLDQENLLRDMRAKAIRKARVDD